MKWLALLLALIAAPLSAQTLSQELDKIIADANIAENALVRVMAAAKRAKGKIPAPTPTPSPTPVFTPTPTEVGKVPAVASGLALSTLVQPAAVPPAGEPAFRFICMPGQLSYDDPIVYPGQPGKAHLHQFFGNMLANAFSNYESLRKTGDSSCMSAANRSGYWMPAMLDGLGQVVRPDFMEVYYKRLPASDPSCKVVGIACVPLPRGLRYVFGWDQTRPDVLLVDMPRDERTTRDFKCINNNQLVGPVSPDMVEPLKACGPGMQLFARVAAPNCWDGKNLDSPDHRSHVAFGGYGDWGYYRCPSTHPYVISQFQLIAVFSIKTGDDTSKWMLSSDHMISEAKRRPGASFHSDWFGAWEDSVLAAWEDHCLDKSLNCSAGVLGDGQQLRQNFPFSWVASPHLVPIPARP